MGKDKCFAARAAPPEVSLTFQESERVKTEAVLEEEMLIDHDVRDPEEGSRATCMMPRCACLPRSC